jgi:stage II sporulation protein D
MSSFFRTDSASRRTAVNCLLAAVLAVAVVVFFSCRRHLVVPVTPQMDISTRYQVRVLLAGDVNHATLQIRGSFSAFNSSGKVLIPESIFTEHGVPMEVNVSNQGLFIAGRCFAATQITILPDDPYIFKFDGADYRGKLVLKAKADNTTFDAINVVPLEPYLAGVVGAEMPDRWGIEALKAQTIAARTYCLYNKEKFGSTRGWDVTRTAASQVYLGLKAESTRIWKAVNDTMGQVLVCWQDGPQEEIFPAYYSSTCGGHTENSKNVFGDSYGPLCGVDCPYCKGVARLDVFCWPMAKFDQNAVQAALLRKYPKLKELGDINDIAPSRQSNYNDFSRLTMIKVTDFNSKSDFLRAEDLRLTIDPSGSKLRSTICRIIRLDNNWVFFNGRGFGHGVGLCQYGAQGMALQGRTAEEILSHYYPGSKLVTAYEK